SSPGAKLSSNNSKPTRDSMSSGNDLIKLNEYSFVSTLSDTTSITTKIIEPKTPGRFVTLEASLCQNPRFSFAFEPTLGIYGQNDFLPNKTNSAGSNVNPPTKIKTKAIEKTGAKLRLGSNAAANKTSIAARTVIPLKKIGSVTFCIA